MGSFVFFLAAPATVAGWIPFALTGWRAGPFAGVRGVRAAGLALVAVSAAALIECFVRFAIVGRGTPAPIVPTDQLVVSGLYRFTRNPMYIAVVSAILGQALFFGSRTLLVYGLVMFGVFHAFILGYEEPTLGQQFTNYAAYCRNVPRWIPRLTPWSGTDPGR
jgi:protein-S-isoprenylcysteine O-methyltransferase Ste14